MIHKHPENLVNYYEAHNLQVVVSIQASSRNWIEEGWKSLKTTKTRKYISYYTVAQTGSATNEASTEMGAQGGWSKLHTRYK